jgi:hypothetical protein
LEEIDIFDSASPYALVRKEYSKAILENNLPKLAVLDEWFAQNYPLTTARAEEQPQQIRS